MDKLDYYKMGLKKGWFKDAFWVKNGDKNEGVMWKRQRLLLLLR